MDQGSTALKRHLKQTHGDLWDFVAPELEAKCAEVKHQLRDGTCPWCERTSYSRHYHQCNVIFQSALLGLLHGRQRDGQQGQQGTKGAKQPRENSSADGLPSKRAKPTRRGGRGRGQGLPLGADRERSDHAGVAMSAARGRIQPHQAGDIPHTAPSTTRARSRAQGAVQRRHRVASQGTAGSQYRPSEWSCLGCLTQARIQL